MFGVHCLEKPMKKFISFVAGLIVGGIIGAVVAALAAPKSGQQLQTDIRKEVDSVIEEGRRAANARRAELEKQLAQMRGDLPLSQ